MPAAQVEKPAFCPAARPDPAHSRLQRRLVTVLPTSLYARECSSASQRACAEHSARLFWMGSTPRSVTPTTTSTAGTATAASTALTAAHGGYDDDLPQYDLNALDAPSPGGGSGYHFTHAAPLYSRQLGDFPPEIIALIVHHLYYDYVPLPHPFPNPDPFIHLEQPSGAYPAAHLAPSLDAQAKELLAGLCRVDKTWSAEATRALWRRVSFGMPRAFESVLRTVEEYSAGQRVARPLRHDRHGKRSASTDSEGSGPGTGLRRRASSRGTASSLGLTMTAGDAVLPDAPVSSAPTAGPVHVAQTWDDNPTPRLPPRDTADRDYFGASEFALSCGPLMQTLTRSGSPQ